jgi:hypothetical protein
LPGQREAESPVPTISAAQVTQSDQLTSLISAMAAQTQATLQVQQKMQAQFQQYQESQQVILEGIRQQQEAQRQQMLQHQMLTSQMFAFMSGCLGQLFQQLGLQLPTTAELQADPTAPLPPAGGFVSVPLSAFPQTPLLQTGTFAVPQTTTLQAAVTTSFLAQLQMTTPPSSQLVSPLTTGALVFETPARTTLLSPPASTPLPTFTTPRTEGLGQEDHYLRAITEQISVALASDTVPPAPEATTAPSTTTVAPPPPPGSLSPAWDILGEDTDDDDTSGFSVRPSRVVSTSPPDPSSPPQA